jgi:Na+/H+ antiporter NhaD/arsenite permease-like protein
VGRGRRGPAPDDRSRGGYNPRHQKTPGGRTGPLTLRPRHTTAQRRVPATPIRPPFREVPMSSLPKGRRWATLALSITLLMPFCAWAQGGLTEPPAIGTIPIDFILFALTLVCVALFHHHTLKVALIGLAVITLFKIAFSPFPEGSGVGGLVAHLAHEWVLLANLLGLLLGFALLSKHFEASQVPAWLPKLLPDDWKGAFVLLVMIFVLSSFLDNIAAALIGGTIAGVVFRRKVHIGYLAAIVAASNAGGSGSVVGDTTTTMMWIDGVSPLAVLEAYIAASLALVLFGIPAAIQQQRYSPITRDAGTRVHIDLVRVFIVAAILVTAIIVNVVVNVKFNEWSDRFPFIGAAVWIVLLACVPLRRPHWEELPGALKGSIFLLSLVLAASMMPVQKLPDASWRVTLGLGFVSAVFDNIPLTALALKQGGYDWGYVAFAVGFGGSMIWFGSSAGVALTNLFPDARSVFAWLRGGWHVAIAYVLGFALMLAVHGWVPDAPHRGTPGSPPSAAAAQS